MSRSFFRLRGAHRVSLAAAAVLWAAGAPSSFGLHGVTALADTAPGRPDTADATPGSASGEAAPLRIEASALAGIEARAIGPAAMSGRVSAMDGVSGDPPHLWVGTAGGGVWRSRDGGVTFEAVFDDHPQSIGAVTVDPSDSATVWVGTGESWTRNSVSVGTGVYRTSDGGESWEDMGLEESERIARIRVDPTDGDRVFVCATGRLWDGGGQRGVYRTTDGGQSWTRVLEGGEHTGCSDLAMDPQEPDVLYAGMWQFQRWPWFFKSGGPGSGLFRTTDGGESWTELTDGLPDGEKGRVAVAVAPSRPNRVYAVVEADSTGLFRSDDLGEHWERVNASTNVVYRPFYFARVVADPTDHERVYKPGLSLSVSEDGGESFTSPFTSMGGSSVHSDHHALWIDPEEPTFLALGTDGGVYVSPDRGGHWRHVKSLPVSQFYEVSVDMDWPYNVYGGLQDNGTWMGPSRGRGVIRNRDWTNIGFGDGFHAIVDPEDPDFVYLEYQGGNVLRYRKSTGEIKVIRPYPESGEPELRFNWNTPLHTSPNEPGTLYMGAQYLFRSSDRGESWERVSPDLTTDDPEKQRQEESGGLTRDNTAAENHTTIFTISESPADGDVIWVGTDDGNLQVTRDGGGSWHNVVDGVPDLPARTWVSHVEASPHRAGAAFVTFDGHRTGDMSSYVYRTEDYGQSWTRISGEGSGITGYAHVVLQDPENPALLFAGTEFGLWVSLDTGGSWTRFEGGLPKQVAVRDLAIHPRDRDLVIATHGRGIWILDDLTPLRHLTPEILSSDLAVLPSRPAVMTLSSPIQEFPGDEEFRGHNPPSAALVHYWQRRRHIFGDLRVEVYDRDGSLITSLTGAKRKGLVRVEWPMRLEPPEVPPAGSLLPTAGGPRVPEGTYQVRVVKGDSTYHGSVSLVPDPRSPHTEEDRRLQRETTMRLYRMLERLAYAVHAGTALRDSARARAGDVGGGSGLGKRLTRYADRLERFRAGLVVSSEEEEAGEEKLRERLGELYGAVSRFDGRPTDSQLRRAEELATEVEEAEARFRGLTGTPLEELNRRLARRDRPELRLISRQEWKE